MSKFWSAIKEIVIILILAFVLAMLLKTFVVDNRIIPTSSMAPTVPSESRILVNRFGYRFSDIEHADVIVFEPTDETKAEANLDDDMLKRVIGLPGETIEVRDGQLYRNDEVVDEDYLTVVMDYNYGPITVPDDSVFVLGDNRNSSFDSHLWSNPFVPIENVKGKAFLIYWPKDSFGKIE